MNELMNETSFQLFTFLMGVFSVCRRVAPLPAATSSNPNPLNSVAGVAAAKICRVVGFYVSLVSIKGGLSPSSTYPIANSLLGFGCIVAYKERLNLMS